LALAPVVLLLDPLLRRRVRSSGTAKAHEALEGSPAGRVPISVTDL
jgi:hypothetical protein